MEDPFKDFKISASCTIIRMYCYNLASETYFETKEETIKKKTEEIRNATSVLSPIATLIKECKWEELFKNQKWLMMLEGAQNYSAIYSHLVWPLKFLAEYFPVETKNYIDPKFLK